MMQQPKTKTEKIPLKIVGFCCKNALNSFNLAISPLRKEGFLLEPSVKIVQLPCSSKVETLGIIKAFESGASGIFVLGCPDGKCHLLNGNHRAWKVVEYTKILLNEIGIEKNRLEMFQIGTSESQYFDQIISLMAESVAMVSLDQVE
jgi:F420-non-reducing hydrogenase iron-sulfur subunit